MAVPKLRFKDENGADYPNWEDNIIGNLTEVGSGSRVHRDEWTENGVKFYRSSDVMAFYNHTKNNMGEAFISLDLYEKLIKKSGKLERNDILVTGGGSIGMPYIITDDEPIYTKDADLIWIKHKRSFNSRFLFYYFLSNRFKDYLKSISHVGTIAHYTINQVKNTPIKVPNLKEQKKIADFVSTFDKRITAQQNIVADMEEIKKGLLQKIFSQEIRFKDENGVDYPAWKKCNLEDIVDVYDGVHQTPKYTDFGIPFVSVENIRDLMGTSKYISQSDFEKDYKIFPTKNDILMTRIGDIGTPALVTTDSPIAYYVSLSLLKLRKNIVPKYLLQFISSRFFKRELWKRTLHIAFPKKINKNEIGKCEVLVPIKEEQQKIASFLSTYDKKIEAEKKILVDLQEMKKGLLQQMFV